jgi:hypothetical protein
VRSLGPIHQLDTEISAILVEHSISVSQASQGFSEASLNEMPIDTPQKPWTPEEVIENNNPPPYSLAIFCHFIFLCFPGIRALFIKPPLLLHRTKLRIEGISGT